ncbi:hypothetical protein [Streptomyces sp. 184]|uniref:hypothetical protein n=1 Tax=Streptomyces sp. 184 TaxID=1827526 RepID=UPI003891F92F
MSITMKRAAVTAVAALSVLLGTAGAASAAGSHAAPHRPCAQSKHVVHGKDGSAGTKRVHVKDAPRGHCKQTKRPGHRADRKPVKKVVLVDGRKAPRR